MKRMLAVFLALAAMCGLFAGCEKKETAVPSSAQAGAEALTEAPSPQEFAWQAGEEALPERVDSLQASVFLENALFLAVMNQSGATQQDVDPETGAVYGYRSYETVFFRKDLASGELKELPLPELLPGKATQINALCAGEDESIYALCMCNGDDESSFWAILHFGNDGTYLGKTDLGSSLDLNPDAPENVYYSKLALDNEGRFYACGYYDLSVFDKDGRLLATLSLDDTYGNLVCLADGQLGILYYADSGTAFRPIDEASLSWGEETQLPIYTWDIFPDAADQSAFYHFDDGVIYRYNMTDESETKFLSLLDCDLDASALENISFTEPGEIYLLLSVSGGGVQQQYMLYKLQKVDAATRENRTVLTLATLSLSQSLRQSVAKFNRESSNYRIEVLDYSQYAEVIASPGSYTEDSTSALLKLNTEILSGNLPDLIDLSGDLPAAQYAAKGYLEDLMPYLEKDPDVSPEKLMGSVIDAMKTGDALYQLPTSFQIVTAAGKKEIVGGYEAWTLEAMRDAMQKLPADATIFNLDMTKENAFYLCLASGLSGFLDWESGTCSFDSPEFRALLSFADSFPETAEDIDYETYVSDYRRVGQEQQLLASISFSGFDDIYFQFEAMGNDVCFVGYPGAERGKSAGFYPRGCLAMTTACKDKDGAWRFLRTLLAEDAQMTGSGFPILRSAFKKLAAQAMEQEYVLDENGEKVLGSDGAPIRVVLYTVGFFSETVDVYAVTPEQYAAVSDLIENTHSVYSFDENIMQIAGDEAAGYFSGAKTLEETAKMIQNRVSLYLAEQK